MQAVTNFALRVPAIGFRLADDKFYGDTPLDEFAFSFARSL